jgi:hypothetical protein
MERFNNPRKNAGSNLPTANTKRLIQVRDGRMGVIKVIA